MIKMKSCAPTAAAMPQGCDATIFALHGVFAANMRSLTDGNIAMDKHSFSWRYKRIATC
jgi:hypothetical protein